MIVNGLAKNQIIKVGEDMWREGRRGRNKVFFLIKKDNSGKEVPVDNCRYVPKKELDRFNAFLKRLGLRTSVPVSFMGEIPKVRKLPLKQLKDIGFSLVAIHRHKSNYFFYPGGVGELVASNKTYYRFYESYPKGIVDQKESGGFALMFTIPKKGKDGEKYYDYRVVYVSDFLIFPEEILQWMFMLVKDLDKAEKFANIEHMIVGGVYDDLLWKYIQVETQYKMRGKIMNEARVATGEASKLKTPSSVCREFKDKINSLIRDCGRDENFFEEFFSGLSDAKYLGNLQLKLVKGQVISGKIPIWILNNPRKFLMKDSMEKFEMDDIKASSIRVNLNLTSMSGRTFTVTLNIGEIFRVLGIILKAAAPDNSMPDTGDIYEYLLRNEIRLEIPFDMLVKNVYVGTVGDLYLAGLFRCIELGFDFRKQITELFKEAVGTVVRSKSFASDWKLTAGNVKESFSNLFHRLKFHRKDIDLTSVRERDMSSLVNILAKAFYNPRLFSQGLIATNLIPTDVVDGEMMFKIDLVEYFGEDTPVEEVYEYIPTDKSVILKEGFLDAITTPISPEEEERLELERVKKENLRKKQRMLSTERKRKEKLRNDMVALSEEFSLRYGLDKMDAESVVTHQEEIEELVSDFVTIEDAIEMVFDMYY